MAAPAFGRLEPKNLRDLWKHEERDFTPWLAQNIEQLSELLGVPIEVEQTEHRVGAYELDILGRVEATDTVVIVENQLTPTDHGHLGQLITYAAGLEAAIVVWVAAEVRDEHRAAIEWLNSKTVEELSFFLVRPEALSIDGSRPAIRLVLEAAPSEFSRRLRRVRENEEGPRQEFRRKFWEAMYAYLSTHGHPWAKGRSATRDAWIASAVGRSGIGVNVSFAQGSRLRVEIYLSSDAAKSQFDRLLKHRTAIESQLPEEKVEWERLEDARASRVAVYRLYETASLSEATPEREQTFAWIARNMAVLRDVARRHLVEGTNEG